MIGIVENVNATHGYLRDVTTWARYFFHESDCQPPGLPELNSRVEYTPIDDYPRGPRAFAVQVIAAPAPTLHRRCHCGEPFQLDAGTQAWYVARKLALPVRCRACRAAGRGSTDAGFLRSGDAARRRVSGRTEQR